ncbi:hypothetical protein [Acidithrix sp. C25]|uniref:hypothetical protein n=1 Tax=Acidithrix sp. C25 TaxID=1671482 RepID=UPI00191BBA13|nr:hypothetical protein [Acidithrix sp. C25]
MTLLGLGTSAVLGVHEQTVGRRSPSSVTDMDLGVQVGRSMQNPTRPPVDVGNNCVVSRCVSIPEQKLENASY